MKTKTSPTMKVFTKRHGKPDKIEEARRLMTLVRRLRGDALVPKGVYRFKTMEEANQWMLQKMASTRAFLNSKT
ncbi:MAG: hypothetical protein Q7T11_00030 [Deltaproteobacteria bacterium]|nr:hypothetical protein [Deltaproteobacteria bacterium]